MPQILKKEFLAESIRTGAEQVLLPVQAEVQALRVELKALEEQVAQDAEARSALEARASRLQAYVDAEHRGQQVRREEAAQALQTQIAAFKADLNSQQTEIRKLSTQVQRMAAAQERALAAIAASENRRGK